MGQERSRLGRRRRPNPLLRFAPDAFVYHPVFGVRVVAGATVRLCPKSMAGRTSEIVRELVDWLGREGAAVFDPVARCGAPRRKERWRRAARSCSPAAG